MLSRLSFKSAKRIYLKYLNKADSYIHLTVVTGFKWIPVNQDVLGVTAPQSQI